MADVYEQNLASKSTLTTTDYIRVVGSDNVSYKQLVSDVAKKIIENYTGSTLAGSAQSVKSALDSLNSKTDGVKAYTIKGDQYFSLNSSESTESVPSSVLVFGYRHVAVVSWATGAVGFNTINTILAPSGNEQLSLDGNRVYTGSDGNRRLTILAPKQISITIETS